MNLKHEEMADLCAIYASDRAGLSPIDLPHPGSPECDALFLATWKAFRHVTTALGKQLMTAQGLQVSECEHMEMFVRGREIPAHVRWAETEALIRSGEWQ